MNQRIAAAMTAKGFDQLRLARALNVSASTVSRWLKPGADLSLETVRRVAEVTQARTETLLYHPERHRELTRSPVTAGTGSSRFRPAFLHAALETSRVTAMMDVCPLERFELPASTPGLPRGPATAYGWTLGHWDEPVSEDDQPAEVTRGTLCWLAMIEVQGGGPPDAWEFKQRSGSGLNALYRRETLHRRETGTPDPHGVTTLSSVTPGDWRWPPELTQAGAQAQALEPALRLSDASSDGALLVQHHADGDYLCLRADVGDALGRGMDFFDMLERRSLGAKWVTRVPPGGWQTTLGPLLAAHGGLSPVWLRALASAAPADAPLCLVYAGLVVHEQYSGWWGQKRRSEGPLYLPLWERHDLLHGVPARVEADGRAVQAEAFTSAFVERLANGGPGWWYTLPKTGVPGPLLQLDLNAEKLLALLDSPTGAATVKLTPREVTDV